MKDQQVSNHNLEIIFQELQKEVDEHKLIILDSKPANIGKWGMAKLWRAWMSTTAEFMAGNGVKMPLMIKPDGTWYGSRAFNADDAHELFTAQWLGTDENGARLSWAKSGNQRKATKGERWLALRKHESWCVEKGIKLFKPRGSEYEQLTEQQEE